MVERLMAVYADRKALLNLTGAVGSGKTSILTKATEAFRARGLRRWCCGHLMEKLILSPSLCWKWLLSFNEQVS